MAQSRRERERQARGDEIVAAAEALFAAHGYAGASMDEIARAAEFTKRTVYQYFASKEELFYAVVLRGMRQLLAYVEAAAGAAGAAAGAAASVGEAITGRERLRRIQAAAYRCTCDYPRHFSPDGRRALCAVGSGE
jgi:AcrR family transcriptional regulator